MSMEQSIRTAIQEAIRNGTRKLCITYKKDSVRGLYALMALVNSGMVKIHPKSEQVIISVLAFSDWVRDENRSFTIELTEKFQESTFVAPMALYLEKIAYAKPKQVA